MSTFTLPDLGEGLQDAEILSWHVSVGDRVVTDQPLVSVETDKAVVEVPAPWSGTVTALHAKEGETVTIGAPLADIGEQAAKDAGAVVGALPDAAPTKPAAPAAAKAESEKPGKEKPAEAKPAAGPGVKAAPAVRRRAAELGVALSALQGSGPDGAILTSDVEEAAQASEGWTRLRGVRRAMARNMARANAEIATTTVTEEANVSHWPRDEDVTIRLARAIVAACRAAPILNAWYDSAREALLLHEHIDLGLAVNTEDGLFVPVLRNAGNRSDADLRAGLEAMKRDIAARSIPPAELRGQTITLSNFGMIGGLHASLIVMPPQVAILGAGRIIDAAIVAGATLEPGRLLPLSLSFDHRVVTGEEAARFLMTAKASLEG